MAGRVRRVYVCVKSWPGGQGIPANGNLRDPVTYYQGTGWQGSGSVVRPGVQHLTPEQALAFVRDRHNLPGGDITRTQRQQAALDYVPWKLKTAGALSDLGKLATLMSTAKGTAIARYFGPATVVTASSAVPAGHVRVSVGVATLQVPASLGRPAQASAAPGATATATGTPSASSGAANGDSISVPKDAPYGIPCVY